MARHHEINYNALANEPRNPFVVQQMPPDDGEQTEDDVVTDTDNEDAPRDNGLMIHVVPDTSKGEWNIFWHFRFVHRSHALAE